MNIFFEIFAKQNILALRKNLHKDTKHNNLGNDTTKQLKSWIPERLEGFWYSAMNISSKPVLNRHIPTSKSLLSRRSKLTPPYINVVDCFIIILQTFFFLSEKVNVELIAFNQLTLYIYIHVYMTCVISSRTTWGNLNFEKNEKEWKSTFLKFEILPSLSLSLNVPLLICGVNILRLWPFFYSIFLSFLE